MISPWFREKNMELAVTQDRSCSLGVSAFNGFSLITRIFFFTVVPLYDRPFSCSSARLRRYRSTYSSTSPYLLFSLEHIVVSWTLTGHFVSIPASTRSQLILSPTLPCRFLQGIAQALRVRRTRNLMHQMLASISITPTVGSQRGHFTLGTAWTLSMTSPYPKH